MSKQLIVRLDKGELKVYTPEAGKEWSSIKRSEVLELIKEEIESLGVMDVTGPVGPMVLEQTYLFSWDSVPGDDDEKFKEFLKDDFDIGWAENAEIIKSDDGKIIRIFKDENSAEIIIDEKKEKASLKVRDGRTLDLKVKNENGKLNIYKIVTGKEWGSIKRSEDVGQIKDLDGRRIEYDIV